MARRTASTLQEELYLPPDEPVRESLEDARALDLGVEQESPFLRGQKRVSVRRGSLPKKTATRSGLDQSRPASAVSRSSWQCRDVPLWRAFLALSSPIQRRYRNRRSGKRNPRASSRSNGRRHRPQYFLCSLAQRQTQLEQIPWVESASVMRFVPNRLNVKFMSARRLLSLASDQAFC